ncbi:hypothetical protein [Fimbriiglobus ruber]|uniref:Uncharacterized protein n=1 Tax=Fimbriiglobus ruber TaxID=1908690 RepID=A0A225D3S0_9BACT|nr:hypothetical protein [Fimbriiglobus ruber]OWK36241.1 hypothetical protein FRUB_08804 [Fimbriiglobus ruber]
MLLIFFSSSKLLARARRSCSKCVTCEKCHETFTYCMSREAFGEDKSVFSNTREVAWRKAEQNAEEIVQRMLQEESDPIPCPSCGWVQEEMIRSVRRRSYTGLKNLGNAFLLFIAGVFALTVLYLFLLVFSYKWENNALYGACEFVGVCTAILGTPYLLLWLLRWGLNSLYNPNTKFVGQNSESHPHQK